jgi:hypothetical protein
MRNYRKRRRSSMDKNQIIETAFETIKESTEWGLEDKSDRYGHWVDGVVTMTDNLLDKLKEEKNGRPVEKY